VLLHHPPIPNKRHYMKRLIDAPILRALIAEHGCELVLHGHNHEAATDVLDGPTGRSRRSACRRVGDRQHA